MTRSSDKPTAEGLVTLYTEVLKSFGLEVSEEGLVSLPMGGRKIPTTIGRGDDAKRLVVPTPTVLKEAQWDEFIAFHPLAENVYRGESAIIKKLRKLVNYRLGSVLCFLIENLVHIAADKEYHKKLSPKQMELLEHLPRANKKTVDAFEKIIRNSSPASSQAMVKIYLKHGGKYKGEDCFRVATTYFPIRDEFKNEDKTVFGVKMASKKDLQGLESLLNYILPHNDEPDAYSYGSRSKEAPYFHALMAAYVKVARQLNSVTWLFRAHIEDFEELWIEINSWKDEDFTQYHDLIPPLAGNDGELSVTDKKKSQHATREKSTSVDRMAQEMENDAVESPAPNAAVNPQAESGAPDTTQVPASSPAQTSTQSTSGSSWSDMVKSQQSYFGQNQRTAMPAAPGWQAQPTAFNNPPASQPAMAPGFGWNNAPQASSFASHPRHGGGGNNWNRGVFPNGV